MSLSLRSKTFKVAKVGSCSWQIWGDRRESELPLPNLNPCLRTSCHVRGIAVSCLVSQHATAGRKDTPRQLLLKLVSGCARRSFWGEVNPSSKNDHFSCNPHFFLSRYLRHFSAIAPAAFITIRELASWPNEGQRRSILCWPLAST